MSYFLGIFREPEFSPGRHTSNDTLILRLVGQALERQNVPVKLVNLEEGRGLWKDAELIFSMCQGPDALAELGDWKRQGARIFNDPAASMNIYRETLCKILADQEIAFPRSLVVSTAQDAEIAHARRLFKNSGAWLKRADVHATRADDVARVPTFEELGAALERFRARGHAKAVLQENIEGDEVKFYAVRGGQLFWPYYPKDCVGHPFNELTLRQVAEDAARVLGLNIYGGDAIISPDGAITLIDLNDWPSFAPCRGAAAHAIARYLKEIHDVQNRRTTVAAKV